MTEIAPFSVSQARRSALVVAGASALIGAWQLHRGRPVTAGTFAVAVAILLACAAVPPAAVAFHRWWMTLAGALGYVNSRIILSVTYYLLITPVGVIMRLAGHDPLDRRTGSRKSYWRRRAATRQTKEGYERSF